jgi:hypothetical protein
MLNNKQFTKELKNIKEQLENIEEQQIENILYYEEKILPNTDSGQESEQEQTLENMTDEYGEPRTIIKALFQMKDGSYLLFKAKLPNDEREFTCKVFSNLNIEDIDLSAEELLDACISNTIK